jgi:anti-sigma regulatory factor (Ser/Thr protein kinase)
VRKPRSSSAAGLSIEIPSNLQSVADMCRRARKFLASCGLSDRELDAWELALREAANNLVTHCSPETKRLPIQVDVLATDRLTEVRITDYTSGFDYPEDPELPPADSESGRGLFLIQSLVDEAQYLRGRAENCLVLRRNRK